MNFDTTLTVCPYCGCGCSIVLQSVDGHLVGGMPDRSSPVNEGKLCIKGWSAYEFVVNDKRAKTPKVRRDGALTTVSWDEALDEAATGLRRIVDEHGPDSVMVIASAKCTNEENYLLQKLARAAIGTNNVDHCARL